MRRPQRRTGRLISPGPSFLGRFLMVILLLLLALLATSASTSASASSSKTKGLDRDVHRPKEHQWESTPRPSSLSSLRSWRVLTVESVRGSVTNSSRAGAEAATAAAVAPRGGAIASKKDRRVSVEAGDVAAVAVGQGKPTRESGRHERRKKKEQSQQKHEAQHRWQPPAKHLLSEADGGVSSLDRAPHQRPRKILPRTFFLTQAPDVCGNSSKNMSRTIRLRLPGQSFLRLSKPAEGSSSLSSPPPLSSSGPSSPCASAAALFEQVWVRKGLAASSQVIDADRLLGAAERYAVEMRRIGQAQSARDMEGNVRKARDLLLALPSPDLKHDLRKLLQYEKSLGIHAPHGHIYDPSGAVGFLWIRRSLSYQHRFFDLVLNHPTHHHHGMNPPDAALRAYRSELQPYHGWALRRLYLAALRAMTPATTSELLAIVGGYAKAKAKATTTKTKSSRKDDSSQEVHISRRRSQRPDEEENERIDDAIEVKKMEEEEEEEEERTRRDLQHLLDTWNPLLFQWRRMYADLDLEDPRRH